MHFTIGIAVPCGRRALLTTVAVVVLTALPAAAQAACVQWNVNGKAEYTQSNLECLPLQFEFIEHSGRLNGRAWHCDIYEGRRQDWSAPLEGSIRGNRMDFKIFWSYGTIGVYQGTISPGGRVSGDHYAQHDPGKRFSWHSRGVFPCATEEAASSPPSPPPPAPGPVARGPVRQLVDRRCKPGFVWREASPTDRVCVEPHVRDRTRTENSLAASRVDPNGAYGPNSCKPGFVWREAFSGDVVCVSPEIRSATARDNALASSRRNRP